ncbi:MAG: response regulator [Planctomycetales bacterium]|nr:response regulator [Planctomycetales bacterium]
MSATVLIVDDSETVRQQVGAALSQAGMQILEARDGNEGQKMIESRQIDCVVCDVNMPNKDGIEMVRDVKKNAKYRDLPIIMLTTEGAKELIEKAKSAGACGWVVKPFKANLLVSAVQKLAAR